MGGAFGFKIIFCRETDFGGGAGRTTGFWAVFRAAFGVMAILRCGIGFGGFVTRFPTNGATTEGAAGAGFGFGLTIGLTTTFCG